MADEQKPTRLYKETLLAMAQNAVGCKLFATFYMQKPDGTKFDAFSGGDASCAAFVSGLLTMLGKIERFHGTVESTVKDLESSDWRKVNDIQPADVLVWEATTVGGSTNRHIGFAFGDGQAISTSYKKGSVQQHEINFGAEQRQIEAIYRLEDW